jgi:small subunit ribosomal protein S16
MLVIRLQRTGRRNCPTYRLVLAEKAWAAKGKSIEILGCYLPAREGAELECESERVTYWIGQGAIPSDTVARLLKRKGMSGLDAFIRRYAKRARKGEVPQETPQPAAASDSPTPSA